MKEPEKVRNHGGGKEEIPIESIELVIEFVGQGFSVPKSLELVKNKGFLSCSESTFYKKKTEYGLDEEYHNAYQARKIILEERLLEEIAHVDERIVSEVSYQKVENEIKEVPIKYSANSAGVQKLELKRKFIAGMNGISQKFRIVEGEKAADQIASIKDAMSKREISTMDAVNFLNVLDKEITLTQFEQMKIDLAATQQRLKNMEIRGK